MQTQRINLGDEVIDKVTGFKGIAVARTQWLTGCDRITVQPKLGKDGKPIDPHSFDEGQLEVVKRAAFKPQDVQEKAPERPSPPLEQPRRGGPRPEPQKR